MLGKGFTGVGCGVSMCQGKQRVVCNYGPVPLQGTEKPPGTPIGRPRISSPDGTVGQGAGNGDE